MAEAASIFHILYVEDDEVDIQNAHREIKKFNVPVVLHVAKNGIEALNKLYGKEEEQKISPAPNLILLDINMPKMNGIEFLKKIQADPDFQYIPVYIVTTAYTTHDKLALQGLQLAGFIIKPLQYNDLWNIYWSLLGAT